MKATKKPSYTTLEHLLSFLFWVDPTETGKKISEHLVCLMAEEKLNKHRRATLMTPSNTRITVLSF